jgi:hypothetical protein
MMMKEKDVRVKKMNELLQGMKILKLYAWEQSFLHEVETIRNTEHHTPTVRTYFSTFCCLHFLLLIGSRNLPVTVS